MTLIRGRILAGRRRADYKVKYRLAVGRFVEEAQKRMNELAGQTAVVTGSSSGIGRAIALELGRAGAAVVVHAGKSQEAAESVASEIEELGSAATVILADLADERALEGLVERAWSWRGKVDMWINNAGADTLTGEAGRW